MVVISKEAVTVCKLVMLAVLAVKSSGVQFVCVLLPACCEKRRFVCR